MLSGFPASAAIDPDMAIRAYLMAVEGIAQEAIARAARLFITGQVKDQNRDFAPSCAAFAEQCRYQQASIDAERRPRIEAKPKVEGPRVAEWKLDLLNAALKGDNKARAKLRTMFPQIDIPDAPEPQEAAE